jgi:template-activating factor I
MAAPKSKRSKTEPEADVVDDEDIQVLEGIQDQIEELNDKATEEILEVERKYNRLRKPIYERRAEAIRKLPEFWFKVFTSQEMLAALLVGDDLAAFKYMKELNVEDHDDVKSGFKISLKFDPNPFFKNEVLSKEFRYDKEGNLTVIPTKIEWKEGKDLTKKPPSKDVKGKRSRDDESESFFTWFNPDDQDLELAEIIKEELWPNPAKYYLGLVEDEAEEEGDDEVEGEEGEDDGDEAEEVEGEEAEEEDTSN